jgi:hypothetical protein
LEIHAYPSQMRSIGVATRVGPEYGDKRNVEAEGGKVYREIRPRAAEMIFALARRIAPIVPYGAAENDHTAH